MQFVYGLLTAVVFFIALLSFYYIGLKQGKQQHTEKEDIDEEVKRRAKKLQQEFMLVMNYNENKARERKRVT
jgi:uncharacterized membrane protein